MNEGMKAQKEARNLEIASPLLFAKRLGNEAAVLAPRTICIIPQPRGAGAGTAIALSWVQRSKKRTLPSCKYSLPRQLPGQVAAAGVVSPL
jgi:hypothetical protein